MNDITDPSIKALEQKSFWRTIIKDSKDFYSLVTTTWLFLMSSPIILSNLKSEKTTNLDLKIIYFENVPQSVYVCIVTIILSLFVNFFRNLILIIQDYAKHKFKVEEKKE